jgi:hypothetical protein
MPFDKLKALSSIEGLRPTVRRRTYQYEYEEKFFTFVGNNSGLL